MVNNSVGHSKPASIDAYNPEEEEEELLRASLLQSLEKNNNCKKNTASSLSPFSAASPSSEGPYSPSGDVVMPIHSPPSTPSSTSIQIPTTLCVDSPLVFSTIQPQQSFLPKRNHTISLPNPLNYQSEIHNRNILNTEIHNSKLLNPEIHNPNLLNPELHIQNLLNQEIHNPNLLNQEIHNPNLLNQEIHNPNLLNQEIHNPNLLNSQFLQAPLLTPLPITINDLSFTNHANPILQPLTSSNTQVISENHFEKNKQKHYVKGNNLPKNISNLKVINNISFY